MHKRTDTIIAVVSFVIESTKSNVLCGQRVELWWSERIVFMLTTFTSRVRRDCS